AKKRRPPRSAHHAWVQPDGACGCGGRTVTMGAMAAPLPIPTRQADPDLAEDAVADTPWQAIVWNDPVNLMSYVTYVLQKLFGYSRQEATRLMLQVHNEGKAVVSSGTREKAEYDVARLHAHGLWATMRQD